MEYVRAWDAGKAYVLVPDLDGNVLLDELLVKRICAEEGFSVAGVIRVVPSIHESVGLADTAEWFMDVWDAAGYPTLVPLEGVFVTARYLVEAGFVEGTFPLATRQGVKLLEVIPDLGAVLHAETLIPGTAVLGERGIVPPQLVDM